MDYTNKIYNFKFNKHTLKVGLYNNLLLLYIYFAMADNAKSSQRQTTLTCQYLSYNKDLDQQISIFDGKG